MKIMTIETLPKDVLDKAKVVGNCFDTMDSYKRMLEAIDDIVNNDFLMDMESKELPNSKPYTQEEALEMSAKLGQVYSISHAVSCHACGGKWGLKNPTVEEELNKKEVKE